MKNIIKEIISEKLGDKKYKVCHIYSGINRNKLDNSKIYFHDIVPVMAYIKYKISEIEQVTLF